MAQYEDGITIGDAITNLTGSSSNLSQETKDAINELLASLGGATTVLAAPVVTTENITTSEIPAGTVIVNQTGDASANVTFAPNSSVKIMTVGGGGNSNVVFQTSDDVVVQLGGGQNDSVATGAGDDTITFAGGSATINTGEGKDVVVLQNGAAGQNSNVTVQMGSGNGAIDVQGLEGTASIDAGDGFDQVRIQSFRHEHSFRGANGRFTMHSDAELNMENVNVVAFNEDGDAAGVVDAITVLADTAGDSLTAKLYQIALGRQGLDNAQGTNGLSGDMAVTHELGGISYWTSVFDQGSNTGADLQHTVYSFLNCAEFHSKYDGMSDLAYVQALFNNLGAANNTTVTTVDGLTAEQMAAGINGNMNARYDAAWTVAASNQAVQILGANGIGYVIDGFTGDDSPTA